jgi:hypothetical protein
MDVMYRLIAVLQHVFITTVQTFERPRASHCLLACGPSGMQLQCPRTDRPTYAFLSPAHIHVHLMSCLIAVGAMRVQVVSTHCDAVWMQTCD